VIWTAPNSSAHVEALRLSVGVAAYIASALEDTAEDMVTEVVPTLHLLWSDEYNDEECDEPVHCSTMSIYDMALVSIRISEQSRDYATQVPSTSSIQPE
jgi:hypothetical protein